MMGSCIECKVDNWKYYSEICFNFKWWFRNIFPMKAVHLSVTCCANLIPYPKGPTTSVRASCRTTSTWWICNCDEWPHSSWSMMSTGSLPLLHVKEGRSWWSLKYNRFCFICEQEFCFLFSPRVLLFYFKVLYSLAKAYSYHRIYYVLSKYTSKKDKHEHN